MHSSPVGERQMLGDAVLPQPGEQVVGVQHRRLGDVLQPVRAERADVGVGAHQAAVVAVEPPQPADRPRAVEVEVELDAGPLPSAPTQPTITGAAETGAIRSDTAIGPEPGPPPP